MKMYSAKVIEDSSYKGKRITTLELEFPRFIQSQFLTHRNFSRNASSSRAVPVKKNIDKVSKDPVLPEVYEFNKAGMQSSEPMGATRAWFTKMTIILMSKLVVLLCRVLALLGLHKQWINRYLEPFNTIKVVVTSTEWDNFYELRNHKDAQPEIKRLAEVMLKAMSKSKPKHIKLGEWHLPYVSGEERKQHDLKILLKISTARCARVSYLNHDNSNPVVSKDIGLHDALVVAKPIHASPSEHQATPVPSGKWKHLQGNFEGFAQYRKYIEKGVPVV